MLWDIKVGENFLEGKDFGGKKVVIIIWEKRNLLGKRPNI